MSQRWSDASFFSLSFGVHNEEDQMWHDENSQLKTPAERQSEETDIQCFQTDTLVFSFLPINPIFSCLCNRKETAGKTMEWNFSVSSQITSCHTHTFCSSFLSSSSSNTVGRPWIFNECEMLYIQSRQGEKKTHSGTHSTSSKQTKKKVLISVQLQSESTRSTVTNRFEKIWPLRNIL